MKITESDVDKAVTSFETFEKQSGHVNISLIAFCAGSRFITSGLGPVGLSISGAFLFNHLSNPSGNADVAAVAEDESFDTCMGHSAPGCIYHYHRVRFE